MMQIVFIFLSLFKENLVADKAIMNATLFTVYIIYFSIIFYIYELTIWTKTTILTVFLAYFISKHFIFFIPFIFKYIWSYFLFYLCFEDISTLWIFSKMLITFNLFQTWPAKIDPTFPTNHFIATVNLTYVCFTCWTLFCTLSQKLLIHCFF